MANNPNKIMATLSNGEAILVYNNTVSILDRAIILSARNEVHTKAGATTGVYRFSDPQSGYYTVINEDDEERLGNALVAEDGALLVKILPIKTYSEKDLAKATPFKKA